MNVHLSNNKNNHTLINQNMYMCKYQNILTMMQNTHKITLRYTSSQTKYTIHNNIL